MRAKLAQALPLATVTFLALAMACSGPPGNCPEMGKITGVEDPASCLDIDSRVGSRAPNFTWEVIDCKSLEPTGQMIDLSDFRGKPVIIAFHKRHGCPGCQQQTPHIKAAYDQRTAADLAVVTIYRGDNASQVKNYVASQGYMLPALADANDRVGSKYGFGPGAPITVFIDATGIIRAEKQGPLESQEEIETILESL